VSRRLGGLVLSATANKRADRSGLRQSMERRAAGLLFVRNQ
jgi:hypothetical protein